MVEIYPLPFYWSFNDPATDLLQGGVTSLPGFQPHCSCWQPLFTSFCTLTLALITSLSGPMGACISMTLVGVSGVNISHNQLWTPLHLKWLSHPCSPSSQPLAGFARQHFAWPFSWLTWYPPQNLSQDFLLQPAHIGLAPGARPQVILVLPLLWPVAAKFPSVVALQLWDRTVSPCSHTTGT